MVNISAKIKLYSGSNKRAVPFQSGYRPLFEFKKGKKTSGQIALLNKSDFFPNEEGIVKITFIKENLFGNEISLGQQFFFYEAMEPLGEGIVIEIL
jgi:hypothetical protein